MIAYFSFLCKLHFAWFPTFCWNSSCIFTQRSSFPLFSLPGSASFLIILSLGHRSHYNLLLHISSFFIARCTSCVKYSKRHGSSSDIFLTCWVDFLHSALSLSLWKFGLYSAHHYLHILWGWNQYSPISGAWALSTCKTVNCFLAWLSILFREVVHFIL